MRGYHLLGYCLTGTAGAHPVKKCRVFPRIGFSKICILTSLGGPLFGSSDIPKPVLFEGQRLIQHCRNSQAKVITFPGWQVAATLGVESLDLHVETAFHAKVSATVGLVFDFVPMVPLIPGEVVELDEETSGPTFAGFAETFLVKVTLLEL